VEEGNVVGRTIYRASERRQLEERMESDRYSSVLVDERKGNEFLPLTTPNTAIPTDLSRYRRAKSDDELEDLSSISMHVSSNMGEPTFKGVSVQKGYKGASSARKTKNFTETRFGAMDSKGRIVELSRINTHNPKWKDRFDRFEAGLDAVEAAMRVGSEKEELELIFKGHLDPSDRVYGSILNHTGYEPMEQCISWTVIEPFDFMTLGVVGGDGEDTFAYFRSTHGFDEMERSYGSVSFKTRMERERERKLLKAIELTSVKEEAERNLQMARESANSERQALLSKLASKERDFNELKMRESSYSLQKSELEKKLRATESMNTNYASTIRNEVDSLKKELASANMMLNYREEMFLKAENEVDDLRNRLPNFKSSPAMKEEHRKPSELDSSILDEFRF